MADQLIRNGSQGETVHDLQQKMVRLGFDIDVDGIFGPATEKAVKSLQSLFGYDVDGLVGEGTMRLIDAQLEYGWNVKDPRAKELAAKSQQKGAIDKNAKVEPMEGKKPGMSAGGFGGAKGTTPGTDKHAPKLGSTDDKGMSKNTAATKEAGPQKDASKGKMVGKDAPMKR